MPLALGHRTALGREDFLVGASNRAAIDWLDLWPRWPAPGLAIYGPAGCGKTHLAEVWRARSQARRIDLATLTVGDAPGLLGDARAAVIDDADRGADERALFHLHNFLAECGGHLLLTARLPPARWGIDLPDLHSRLSALPAVEVLPPDESLIEAVLVKLFADRQLRVGPDVVAYIVPRLERSFAAVRQVAAALDAASLAARRAITVPLARDVLNDLARIDRNET
ncbi:MAG: DNA replication protein [Rhodospirillales bacterium]|nr:DNA replication protein [Rhodospirillales bacterium]